MSLLDAQDAACLVRRIASGESGAEAELVERCGRTLRFLARRHARREADAEDLYQETLIVALEKIRRSEVREPERLAGFLRALVKNLAVQTYRRRHHDAERSDAEMPEPPDERRLSALDGLLDGERRRVTRQVLGELSVPRDQEILQRYYFAEESSSRICDDLGIDTDHFYRVLHRARQRYRRLWEERVVNA